MLGWGQSNNDVYALSCVGDTGKWWYGGGLKSCPGSPPFWCKSRQDSQVNDVIVGQPLVCCVIIYLPGTSDGGAVTNYQTPHIQSVRKF